MLKGNRINAVDWQKELHATALKFHVLIAWVAVALNPIWVVGDYYNAPKHFKEFLIFRIVISIATLIGIAYMYSVMNVAELQKHTFAYIALFIGAGMFVLWRPMYSVIVVVVSFIANVILFDLNSDLKPGEILINGGLLTASVAIFTILLIHTRTNLTKREIIARLSLAESNKELEVKNKIIHEKKPQHRGI